jgi:hypothetical protein
MDEIIGTECCRGLNNLKLTGQTKLYIHNLQHDHRRFLLCLSQIRLFGGWWRHGRPGSGSEVSQASRVSLGFP